MAAALAGLRRVVEVYMVDFCARHLGDQTLPSRERILASARQMIQ